LNRANFFQKLLDPILGSLYYINMRIISRKKIRKFWEKHSDARQALESWYADAKQANWKTPSDIKNVYKNASFVANNRVVFNIKGNKFRLVAAVQFEYGIIYIRFVGTHKEYDKIDATTV